MYYLELIQKFWNFNQKAKIDTSAVAVYFYLLKLANDCDSYTVSISDQTIGRTLGISRNTVMAARKKLQGFGLVEYNRNKAAFATYRLLLNYDKEEPNVDSIETETLLPDLSVSSAAEDVDPSSTSVFSFTSDDIKKNTAPNEAVNDSNSEVTYHDRDQPYLKEFLEYAKTLDDYEPSLDSKITEKYSSWKKNDWKSVSGRPITDWKSSLRSLMPFMKNTADQDLSLTSISRIKRPK